VQQELRLNSLVIWPLWECRELSSTRSAEIWETGWEQWTVFLGMMQYSVYSVSCGCRTQCKLNIMGWRDIEGGHNFVFLGDGRVQDEKGRSWEKIGNHCDKWGPKIFERASRLTIPDTAGMTPDSVGNYPTSGHSNPIGHVVPLISHIYLYSLHHSHLNPPSLCRPQLYHHHITQSWVIPLYLSMLWLWLNTI